MQKDPPKTLTLAQSKGNTPAGNGPSDSRKDEGGGPSGKVGQAKVGKSGAEVGDSLPNNLMKYTASRKLMNALEPYAARFQSPPGNQDIVLLRAVGAVAGLNHLKRCERDLKANALERERFDSIMRVFAVSLAAPHKTEEIHMPLVKESYLLPGGRIRRGRAWLD